MATESRNASPDKGTTKSTKSTKTTICEMDAYPCQFNLPASVSLLLPSTETLVLLDALESFKKFVGKSIRNKELFLSLNEGKALEMVIVLVNHEDEAVSLASLELLAALVPEMFESGVFAIRKKKNAVPAILTAVEPPLADAGIHEAGIFCLIRLCRGDLKSTMKFHELDGLDVMVKLMAKDNFDVVVLVMRCLVAVCQESLDARYDLFHMEKFVKLIIAFCNHEMPEIQSLSLDLIALAAQHRQLRNHIRCVKILITIGKKLLSEEEVPPNSQAVKILQTFVDACTGEEANIRFAQGLGLLHWSLDVVAERDPQAKRWDKTFELSLRLLAKFSVFRENRLSLQDLSIDVVVMKLAHKKSRHCVAAALELISKLCENDASKIAFGQRGAMTMALTYLMAKAKPPGKDASRASSRKKGASPKKGGSPGGFALGDVEVVLPHETNFAIGTACLASLTSGCRTNVSLAFAKENLSLLTEFLKAFAPTAQIEKEAATLNTFNVVRNLHADPEQTLLLMAKTNLVKQSVLPYVEIQLEGGVCFEPLVRAIDVLTVYYVNRILIEGEESGEEKTTDIEERQKLQTRLHSIIAKSLESEDLHVCVAGARLAESLAKSPDRGVALIDDGIVDILWNRFRSSLKVFPKSMRKQTERCLDHILGCNLSLKYTILGRLTSFDRIGDYFDDIGAKLDAEDARRLLLGMETKIRQPRYRETVVVDKGTTRRTIVEEVLLEDEGEDEGKGEDEEDGDQTETPAINILVPTEEFPPVAITSPSGTPLEPKPEKPEKKYIEIENDPTLLTLIDHVLSKLKNLPRIEWKIKCLAILVFYQFGGRLLPDELFADDFREHLRDLVEETLDYRVTIGSISKGVAYHRALLFKVLADELLIPCTLIRGDYFRAWNEIWLMRSAKRVVATDRLRWMLHDDVNSDPKTKEEIPELAGFEEFTSVVAKGAPPDSLCVSLAMAMAIQTQFLKILLYDDRTAKELLSAQPPPPIIDIEAKLDSSSAVELERAPSRVCHCIDHNDSNQCGCCDHCPGWVPPPTHFLAETQAGRPEEESPFQGPPGKFVVDLCYYPARIISDLDAEKIKYMHI